MTVPFGPFRVVVSITRRCRDQVLAALAQGATDAELARLATSPGLLAAQTRLQAERMLYGSRLV